jgi:hypothetical protein
MKVDKMGRHAERMWEIKNTFKVSGGKTKWKRPLGGLGVYGRIILKLISEVDDSINLAWDWDQWRAYKNKAM